MMRASTDQVSGSFLRNDHDMSQNGSESEQGVKIFEVQEIEPGEMYATEASLGVFAFLQ